MTDRILILDFGSQVTQLIARRVRENGVYCEIQPYTVDRGPHPRLRPARRHPVGRPGLGDARRPRRARPISCSGSACRCSAICYGMQTMCAQLGGRVTLSDHQEFGRAFIDITGECRLFDGLWPQGRARAGVDEPRRQGRCACRPASAPWRPASGAPYAAIADDERRFYGVLFHPEVVHTPQGGQLLAQLHAPRLRAAAATGRWRRSAPRRSSAIRDQVGCGPRRLRPLGRRRFRGRRGAAARGDRRPADLHLCRYRPAAARARPRRSCACSAAITTSR